MYRGEWASKFVDAVRQEGGKMILRDLLDYQADWREAERGTYETYDVATLSPPNLGGVRVIEALNFLELANASHFQWPSSKSRYPLFHYKYFPFTLYWLVQIADFAYLYPENTPLTASRYFPSADFSPVSRVKKANAFSIWAVMQDPNWPRLYQDYHDQTSSAAPDIGKRDDHSAAVVVVDEFGNMAAVEHTINTTTWGTTGILVRLGPPPIGALEISPRSRSRDAERPPAWEGLRLRLYPTACPITENDEAVFISLILVFIA